MSPLVLHPSRKEPSHTLREWYAKYGGSVLSRCRYLLKDATRAEDAMQDVFAKALTREAEFRGQSSVLTWLMKIATHHCLNLMRAERARWLTLLSSAKEDESREDPSMETRELVRALLGRFDLETQQAVVHYWVDEMTLAEVAEALGRSVPTIRKRLQSFADASGKVLTT